MEHEYSGIEYHSDGMGREGHAAVNVKRYRLPSLPEAVEQYAEQAFEQVQEDFWERATEYAHDSGYSGVFSEGRSGGWLVPFYQYGMSTEERERRNLSIHPKTRAVLFYHSPGQGGGLGYPRYPDVDNIGERARFRAFQRKIESMLEGVHLCIERRALDIAADYAEQAMAIA